MINKRDLANKAIVEANYICEKAKAEMLSEVEKVTKKRRKKPILDSYQQRVFHDHVKTQAKGTIDYILQVPTCGRCKYGDEAKVGHIICHRFPPHPITFLEDSKMVTAYEFTHTLDTMVCGEYKRRK